MLKKTFVRSLYIIPATAVVILFATYLWEPNHLITPPQLSGFEKQIETALPVLLIALYSFILPNKFEIELGLVNGYSTLKLVLTKAIPIFLYTIPVAFLAIAFYQYTPYDSDQFKSLIPIYVPEDNFKLYTFISVFVIILFFSSVFLFLRVLTRNCFLPVITDLLFLSAFVSISEGIQTGFIDLRVCLIDPFITVYFIGNEVPNAYADQVAGMSILRNAWTVNRIAFFLLSLVLLAATVFLLRREKLHRGLGD